MRRIACLLTANPSLSNSYQYVYDADRRLVAKTFPSGGSIFYIYDNTLLSQVQTPDGNISYGYLSGGRVGSAIMGTESVTYGYDGDLVISETFAGTLNQTLSYTFNNDFNLTGFTYAGATEPFSYDNDGLLTGSGSFTISRNAQNGLPESVSDGILNITRTFNGYGEIETQSRTAGGLSLISWSLVRDQNGRITRKTENTAGIAVVYDYAYDAMGRLLNVFKDNVLVEEYAYNDNGARILGTSTTRGIAGRVSAYSIEDHLVTAGDFTYQYDLDSFLLSKTRGTDETLFTYSLRGELLNATLPDGTFIEYLHDPYGNRIAKKVDGVITEKYLWQGLTQLLAVYDGSDNLLMRFQYADGRMPVAMTKAGSTYYLAYDQVGSLRVVADHLGNVVKQITYDTFGNIITDTNPLFEIPFAFAGGLYDPDTGLIRFGFRDYDPEIGRWTAKDPIFFAGGDTDLFGYVMNDPVNWVDPGGLEGIATAATILILPKLPAPPPALAVVAAFGLGVGVGTWLNDNYIGPWLWDENTEEDSQNDCPKKDEKLSDDIAEHSKKHNPRIPTDELSELIKDTIGRGEKKNLERGRRAYRDPLTGRVVIVDPNSPNKGTSFVPKNPGYFDGLK